MIKMMKGEKVTGGTVFSARHVRKRIAPWRMPATISSGQRCSTIRAIGKPSGRMWKACPHAKAVPGVRVAYTDEREIQHAMDLGRAGDRRAHGSHRGGGNRRAELDHVPAARQAQRRAAARLSIPRCGATCRAGIATRSTTTSC